MKNIFILLSLLVCVSLASCDDDEYNEFNTDNRPEVPVTYQGATTFGFNPYITHSISGGGNISVTLQIPENSGRSISEITKVVAGSTSLNAGNVASAGTAESPTYNEAPIQGSGNTVTFTTTLEEFVEKTGLEDLVVPGGELAFMFLVTLDNGDTIIPVQLRVRLTE